MAVSNHKPGDVLGERQSGRRASSTATRRRGVAAGSPT